MFISLVTLLIRWIFPITKSPMKNDNDCSKSVQAEYPFDWIHMSTLLVDLIILLIPVTEEFKSQLANIHDEMMKCYEKNQHPINMTSEDEIKFKSATICHICNRKLNWESEKNYPVRDHDYLKKQNNFGGAACNSCTINYFNKGSSICA